MSYSIGLTGGIGSGKSTVGRLFEERGIEVIDADAIAHELTAKDGAALPALREMFGEHIVTAAGALDRAALRTLAFADPSQRKRLEAVLHPMIRALTDRRVAAARSAYVVLMIPLLVETGGFRDRVRRIAVVDCLEETQIRRVMARSGMTRAEITPILAAQASRAQRLALADDTINNDGEPAALIPQIERLHEKYLTYAAHSG
ncbi:MAG TPA: dephospho-CoA kinase [Rhodocyclaceae bacterium]|nr:dephospho-CoA kinase [Rhodocyclaceae bacterium]